MCSINGYEMTPWMMWFCLTQDLKPAMEELYAHRALTKSDPIPTPKLITGKRNMIT